MWVWELAARLGWRLAAGGQRLEEAGDVRQHVEVAEEVVAGQPVAGRGEALRQAAILTASRLVLGPSQSLPRSSRRLKLAYAGCTAGWLAQQAPACRLPSASQLAGPSRVGGRHNVPEG